MKTSVLFLLLQSILSVSPLLAETVTIKEVTRGNVCVLGDEREVRSQGIEVIDPELALGKAALLAHQKLVADKDLRLELDAKSEKRDKLRGFFFAGKIPIHEELVRGGHAYVLRPDSAPYTLSLLKAEAEARKAGRGLWAKLANSGLVIVNVHAQVVGSDEHSLNDEFVVLENRNRTPVNITGWKLCDEAHHTYTFPKIEWRTKVKITLRTGSGLDMNNELHWDSKHPIWNNDHDTVFLFDAEGFVRAWHQY